jgi:serine/threonine protein kinase
MESIPDPAGASGSIGPAGGEPGAVDTRGGRPPAGEPPEGRDGLAAGSSVVPDAAGSSPGDSASRGSSARPSIGADDATVISSRPVGGPMSMAEIGRTLEGRTLGPYQLERFVGGGGMGAVFRALDTTLDRIVAVKVLSRQQSSDEEMLKRFRNEAQSAARLDHENIGRVHAVGSDDGWHYIVFEFIEGTNLRDVVNAEGPFDLARTMDVTIQIADALEHAADRDVVHRDIKPSNIIITPAGRARIVDMGLARLHHVAGDQDLTVSGMTLGTFDYISPEQARDPRSADSRSDLYSLGCTIFFMLAGRPPFAEGTMVQKLLQHQQDAPPAIESLRPDVPARFGAILARLMAKDPADRYQRPADLVADLAAFADDAGIELAVPRTVVTPVEMPVSRSPAAASNLPWLLPVLGLVLVIGLLWMRSSRLRSTASPSRVVSDAMPGGGAADGAAPGVGGPRGVRRVVETPAGPGQHASVADAVREAADGDVIELSYSSTRDEPPSVIEGKRLVLRAADGFRPIIRFVLPEGTADSAAGRRAGFTVVSGSLGVQGVGLQLDEAVPEAAPIPPAALFELRGRAAIGCEDAVLRMPGEDGRSPERSTDRDIHAGAAFVRIGGGPDGEEARAEVGMRRSAASGDAVFVDASGRGLIDVLWAGGSVATAHRFLLAEGSPRANGGGLTVRLSLSDGLFACREGFACLLDSPASRAVPELRVFAERCRFLVPEGRALLEQSGVNDPELYRSAVDWLDTGSRYEGSEVFRRIDGSAERVEMNYAASSQPLIHTARLGEWPDEAGRGAGSGDAAAAPAAPVGPPGTESSP